MSENNTPEEQKAENAINDFDVLAGIPGDEQGQDQFESEIPESVIQEANQPPSDSAEEDAEQVAPAEQGVDEPADKEASAEEKNRQAMLAKAADLRAQVAQDPYLVGGDADLLAYNRETGTFEPVDSDAKHMLALLGKGADIGVVNPGSKMATPMHFMLTKGLTPDKSKPPFKVADNHDSKANMQIGHENTSNRLQRLADRRAETPTIPLPGTEGDESESDETANPDASSENDQQRPAPPMPTASSHMAEAAAGFITSSIVFAKSAVDMSTKALNGIGELVGSIYNGAKSFLINDPTQLRSADMEMANASSNAVDLSNTEWLQSPEGRSEAAAAPANDVDLGSDPITPDAQTNATAAIGVAGIADRMKTFQSQHEKPAIAEAERIRDDYKVAMKNGLGEIESALKLNEVGQIPLVSAEDFEVRMKSADPEDKDRAEKALKEIVSASEKYQSATQKFMLGNGESRAIDKLSPESAHNQIEEFDKLAAKPGSDLEDHQKKLLDKLGIEGTPMGERLDALFGALRNMMQSVSGRVSSLSTSQAQSVGAAGQVNANYSEPSDEARQG